MGIKIKNYELKGNLNATIVLISDIHYYSKEDIKALNKITKRIKKLNPDYICIPGDLVDESIVKDFEYLLNWLKELAKTSKVLISLGNHEFYKDKKNHVYSLNNSMIDKIKKIENLYLLDNTNKLFDNINFIGITLPLEFYFSNQKNDLIPYLNKLKKYNKCYNVLLCHSPIDICDKKNLQESNIDLVLCGHMHGGVTPRILRIFLGNRGLISPKLKLLPKNAYGHLKFFKTDIVITSGITVISKNKILKKLFSKEIVKIKINKD